MKYVIIGLILISVLVVSGCTGTTGTTLYDAWKSDGISLMQHETEGTFGCFGCSGSRQEPAMCVDPIMEMRMVEETPERYCNSDFEVVENCCSPSQISDGYACYKDCGPPVIEPGDNRPATYRCISAEEADNRERYGCPI